MICFPVVPDLQESVGGRAAPSAIVSSGRVIAVLRARAAAAYGPVIDVLAGEGISSIELTLTTPGTLEVVADLVERHGAAVEIGVGTVLDATHAEQALLAGAAYLVTPTVCHPVVELARRHDRPVYPGAFTPTEVQISWAMGATAVKLFPASHLGPSYLSALRGPLPDVAVLPSGGVRIDDIPAWLQAGALAVGMGGELIGDAFAGGDLRELAGRARRVRQVVDGCTA